jgi:hypothetical protein
MKPEYAAGLLDADGCITIIRAKRSNTIRHVLRVEVSMCHRGVIEKLGKAYGGSVVFRPLANKLMLNPREVGIRDIWMWIVSAQKAAKFLEAVAPHLIVKKAEAAIALRFQRRLAKTRKGLALTAAEMEARNHLADLCSALKRRRYDRSS